MSKKEVDSVTGEPIVAEVVQAATQPEKRRGDVISQYLVSDQERIDVAPSDTHKAIIEEILSSGSLEDLLAQNEAEPLENFLGRVIEVRSFSVNDSEFQDGAPIYVAIKLTDMETGERRVATSGEQNVMAQLLKAEQMGWLPFKTRPYQSTRPNRHSRFMIRFGPAEA